MTDTVSTSSETVTLTVKLPRDLVERFQALIGRTQWDLDTHVAAALTYYIPNEERELDLTEAAIAEADSGAPGIPHEKVMEWMESWGTPNELPPPA